jgi:hypothetical protein
VEGLILGERLTLAEGAEGEEGMTSTGSGRGASCGDDGNGRDGSSLTCGGCASPLCAVGSAGGDGTAGIGGGLVEDVIGIEVGWVVPTRLLLPGLDSADVVEMC